MPTSSLVGSGGLSWNCTPQTSTESGKNGSVIRALLDSCIRLRRMRMHSKCICSLQPAVCRIAILLKASAWKRVHYLRGDEKANGEVALAQGAVPRPDDGQDRSSHGYLVCAFILSRDVLKEPLQSHTADLSHDGVLTSTVIFGLANTPSADFELRQADAQLQHPCFD